MPIDLSSPSESAKTPDSWASTAEELLGRYRRVFAKAAAVSDANCPKVAVRGEDRLLSDLGADADKVHGKIVSAIRDRSISDNPGELADLWDLARCWNAQPRRYAIFPGSSGQWFFAVRVRRCAPRPPCSSHITSGPA